MYRFYYCKPRIENWLYTFCCVLYLNPSNLEKTIIEDLTVGGSLIGKQDTLIWALDRKSFHFWLYQRFRVRQLFWDATQLL